ncbi:MAG TPA: hypothetical protein VF776_08415 [Sphingomicrobium sp.]
MTCRPILIAAGIALGTSAAMAAPPAVTPGGTAPATPAQQATPADPPAGASATPAAPATTADPATSAAEPSSQPTNDTTQTATPPQPNQKVKKNKKK